jgi:hypothetical protein
MWQAVNVFRHKHMTGMFECLPFFFTQSAKGQARAHVIDKQKMIELILPLNHNFSSTAQYVN